MSSTLDTIQTALLELCDFDREQENLHPQTHSMEYFKFVADRLRNIKQVYKEEQKEQHEENVRGYLEEQLCNVLHQVTEQKAMQEQQIPTICVICWDKPYDYDSSPTIRRIWLVNTQEEADHLQWQLESSGVYSVTIHQGEVWS
jgi:superfamily II DNA/RNA helicase